MSSTDQTPATFRVLSLDGGGIKGTYSAAFLAELERMTGKAAVDHFDLIVGTSTGGIIALGLGLGITAREILHFYESRGPDIFPLTGISDRFWATARHILLSKRSPSALRSALVDVFGESTLGDAATRLVIPAYNGSTGDIRLFKTAHHSRLRSDHEERAVDVAMATSAAPTFLPAFTGRAGTTLVDGGVWANCPVAVAAVEAIAVLNKPAATVDILSVGTTEEPLHVPRRKAIGGWIHWAKFAPTVLMQAQARGALAHANLLTGNRVLRVQHMVKTGRFKLDDPRSIDQLKALGAEAAMHKEAEVSSRFLTKPIVKFHPVHSAAPWKS